MLLNLLTINSVLFTDEELNVVPKLHLSCLKINFLSNGNVDVVNLRLYWFNPC